VRHIEKKLEKSCPPDTLHCPDILLLQCEELAVIDNLSGQAVPDRLLPTRQAEAFPNAKRRLREMKDS
jgi:anthranilate synthase component 1